MITEIKGDLIKLAKEGNFDIIVHGCNTKRRMGAGIALSLKNEFPIIEKIDNETTNNILGYYDIIEIKKYNFSIVNAYTQFSYGKASAMALDSQSTRYNAIRKVMNSLNKECRGFKIGLPLIGCGLAGGDWNIVKKIIEEELKDCNVTIVHYDK
jgi:O-acetyl-ADP-ribose deacetylase (regulator of RNase III)